MKFEDSSLTGYLVKHLEPLTEADPTILAEYVVALLKKDKSIQELQKLCIDNLVEFLGHGTNSFVAELFRAFEDGTIIRPLETFDEIEKSDPSPSIAVDPVKLESSPPKEDNPSTSGPVSDSEDKEISDDEDDDRNHKHRRRDNRPQPLDEDAQDQFARNSVRKRNKPYENGQLFVERDPQSFEGHKEYNPSLERDLSANFERRRPGLAGALGNPMDLGQKTRTGRPFRTSNGLRFDLSTSVGRPPGGGGRGRGTGSWNQHDSRFSPIDALGFAPQMTSQMPSLLGAGFSSAASTQSTSWGAYGFIPGMPNGCLDPLHPLNLQGALHPSINTLTVGMPRQRCRDFEERGFCLRGDMCPMEHGINRIVVEDVQSLSQFNLPVSLPSSSILGTQAPAVPLPPITSSNLLANKKSVPSKNTKSMVSDDGLGVSGILSASAAGGEADVYDPDQPLWNNDHPESSGACLRLPSPKTEDVEPMWEAGPSDHQDFGLSASMGDERPSGLSVGNHGSQGTGSSVWGRIKSGNKFESTRRIDNAVTTSGFVGNKAKEEREGVTSSAHIDQTVAEETGVKAAKLADADSGRKPGRASQKAQRTLFVNGIPQKSNRRDALLSHFQKFGEVMDIYIPLNSEKAFVQFSKREEAEAALKAPDAVMGNRFIKLWWANRDNVADGESRAYSTAMATRSTATLSARLQTSTSDKGGESRTSPVPKASSAPAIDGPVSTPISSKASTVGGPKATPLVQSKVENLELLKDELRRKQESLAQKRNDFKRQLDKLEKQALGVGADKAEMMNDRAVKIQKMNEGAEVTRSLTPNSAKSNIAVHKQPVKAQDKGSSWESIVSPGSKGSSTLSQQSPRNLKLTNYMPGLFINRFKLDNRPTAFRIIPPLPADLTNAATLKEHFSSFGDLVMVELEHVDTESSTAQPSLNCSAIITFATRRSAEKAFSTAKCWQGHSLQFAWVISASTPSISHGAGEISANQVNEGIPDTETVNQVKEGIPHTETANQVKEGIPHTETANQVKEGIPDTETANQVKEGIPDTETANQVKEGIPDTELQSKPLTSGLSSLSSEIPSTNPEGGDTDRGHCAHAGQQDCDPEISGNGLMQVSHSSPVSCEERPPAMDIPLVEDDTNGGLAQ